MPDSGMAGTSGIVVRWVILIPGLIVTAIAALSVHAFMLEILHVPYPANLPHTGWTTYPADATFTFATLIIYGLSKDKFERFHMLSRIVGLFVLLAALKEVLVRATFMDLINMNPPTIYPIVGIVPKLIPLFALAAMVVWSEGLVRTKNRRVLEALSIAAVLFACTWPIDWAFSRILHALSYLNTPSRYNPPYDYHILIPAYLTFIEPVIASFIVGRLVWDKLSRLPLHRTIQLTALIFLVRGPVFGPFINIFYANTGPVTSMLSDAQFSFETLTLGLLASLTLTFAFRIT